MKQKKFTATLLLLAMVIFAGIFSKNDINASAASASLSASYKLMYVGQSYTAKVKGSSSSVKWSTSNSNIASVSSSGKVTGQNIGRANIYATVNGKKLTLKVEVVSKSAYTAVNYANNAVGCRYSQARRMSKGYYDCGSLVWRSYASAGVYIGGKTSWAPTAASSGSILNGSCKTISFSSVSASELLPGDLIFTSSHSNGRYRNITHAAIYVGNGKIVEAANSRVGVVKRNYSTKRIVLVARPTVSVSKSLQQPQLTSVKAASSSVNNTTINVSWKKVRGASGYYIYRKTAGGSYKKIATVKGGSKVSYTDKTAYAGKYVYTVRAYSGSKTGSYNSKGMTASTKIASPTGIQASAVNNGITVKWNTVKYATGYQIYRKAAGGSYTLIKTVSGQKTAAFTDTKAQSGTAYAYMVKAYRKSASSNVVSASSSATAGVTYTKPVTVAASAPETEKETVATVVETAATAAAPSSGTTAAETTVVETTVAETTTVETTVVGTTAAETAAETCAVQTSERSVQETESTAESSSENESSSEESSSCN
ncbi:MAG: NlpC/P60 family protein [Lachnospiraceae bacterium]|nr:NlpC/P60 family protein [Lachnospiraceae bacterium]